jgi:hypothetical protein
MNDVRAVVAALLLACLGGTSACSSKDGPSDGGDAPDAAGADAAPRDACAAVTGNRFSSVSRLECGPAHTDGGAIVCYWHLDFTVGGTFYWQHSDYGESGTYTCEGNRVTGTPSGGATITAQWNPASARLSWAGQDYALEAPLSR